DGLARRDVDGVAHVADERTRAAGVFRLVQRNGGVFARLRNPGGQEVMLEDRDPATGAAPVDAAVFQVVLVELAALVATVVPGGAVEVDGPRNGHAALDQRRIAGQLAVDRSLPRRAAGIDHFVAHLHRVLAAFERV